MNNPLISIIIATYQAESVLDNCLKSIVNLGVKDIELIIIDGGSTDKTLKIIDKYSTLITYFFSGNDRGIYDAMNKGIAHSKGEYLYFLGADDEITPEFANSLFYLKDTNCIYYGNVVYHPSGLVYDGKFNSFKIVVKNICHQSIFYPREVFSRYKYQLQFKLLADYYLNLQLFADKQFSFKYLPYTICKYNELGSSSMSFDQNFINEKLTLIKNNFNFILYFYCSFRKFISKNLLRRPYY